MMSATGAGRGIKDRAKALFINYGRKLGDMCGAYLFRSGKWKIVVKQKTAVLKFLVSEIFSSVGFDALC